MDDSPISPSPLPDPRVASGTVNKFAAWSAAVAMIPVPFFVLTVLVGLQLQLLRRLSKLRGVPFSRYLVRSIAASLAGSFIATLVGDEVLGSLVKIVPIVGPLLGVLALPFAAAATTWLLGRTALRLW